MEWDVVGMALRVVDPRGIVVQEQRWDLLGRAMTTLSPDSGFTLVVYDVQGQPVEVRKAGALRVEQEYDTLRRPSRTWVTEGAGPRREVERKVYGEAVPEGDPLAAFARTRLVRVYDTAGRVSVAYDWKGRPVSEERRFWAVAADEVDWSGVPTTWSPTTALLEATAYTTSRSYDALDRPITETTPDGTVTTSTWSIRSLPETVTTGTLPVVSETAYNARGQRTSARLGLAGEQVGVVVAQQWDPTTFRLRRVTARRGTTGPWLQDLRYWYDAVGNPTRLDDAAADEEFFANALVGPGQDFTHDALYRLIAATGREKSGMGWEPAGPAAAVGMPNTMGLWRYRQEYEYDESGNLVEIVHRRGDPLVPGWTRTMVAATTGNRVVSGQLGSDPATTYAYTARGAMTTIETIAGGVEYDFRDQLRHVETNLAGNAAHYLYDGSGRRVRKVVEKSGQTEVRSYVGAYEEWERRVPGTVVDRDGELVDRRTTVHVMDGERRVGMVEVKTHADGEVVSSPTPIARLVLGNVVGSAMLEVTEAGEIISYEEFHPYGTTVYWLESGEVDVSPRRYRYTGQERDEETGLQYHWHRYYAPWLGRWTSADPAGLVDGGNRCQTRPYGSALGEWAPG